MTDTAATDWVPGVGDRVIRTADVPTATEIDDGARVGVIIDTSVLGADGLPMVAVQFPYAEATTVLYATELVVVERASAETMPPQRIIDAAASIGRSLGGLIFGGGDPLIVNLGGPMEPPAPDPDLIKHVYKGKGSAACEVTGCGMPDKHELHEMPPYRLEFLDEIPEGTTVYLPDGYHLVEYTLLRKREAGGQVACVLIDSDGDQRPFTGHILYLLPVKL